MKRVILTVIVTLVVVLAIPLIVFAVGLVDMGAATGPGPIEEAVAGFAVERSVASRAPEKANPFAGDAQAISTGLDHYAAMCARCHGGPGVKPQPFALGLNPPAPDLQESAKEMTDGELFWITKHGIRMTGMPAFGVTHEDEEIWKIAAIIKQLPKLSAEQKRRLSQQSQDGHGHHEGGHDSESHGDHGSEAPNNHAGHHEE